MYLNFSEIELYEDNNMFFFITDADGLITFAPSVCEQILNYSSENFINKLNYSEFFKAEYKEKIKQKISSTIKKKARQTKSFSVHLNNQATNGTYKLNINILYNQNNCFNGLFGIIHYADHTKEAVNIVEKKYRQLINNIPLGVYRTTKDGEIIFANQGLVDIFHYSNINELEETNINHFYLDEEFRLKAISRWSNTEHYSDEFQVYTKDKKQIWVKDEGRVVKNKQGEILYFDGIIEDISLKKIEDDKLKVSELNFKELNIAKDKFFSVISHDLKAPFGQFISATDLILDRINEFDTDQIEKLIKLLNQQARQSYKLLENLLEWSKNQKGLIKYNPKPLSVGNLINDVIADLSQMASNKSISINSSIQPNLIIYADKYMLSSILRNLISNAIKFTRVDGNISITKTYIIPTDPLDDKILEISVTDNGVGMREEEIVKLFKIDTTFSTKGTQRESGTGLGLILCKDFVNKQGGKISVESELGKGSTFKFTLP